MNDTDTIEVASADSTIERVADIVAAYVSHNNVPAAGMPELIGTIHAALAGLSQPAAPAEAEPERATPAQIRKSITHEALISFIDGKPYKTLKRHLTKHGLDLRGYRARFGLPKDYPSTAAGYSEARSAMARQIGLGQIRKVAPKAAAPAETASAPAEASTPAKKPDRGRKKAAAAE